MVMQVTRMNICHLINYFLQLPSMIIKKKFHDFRDLESDPVFREKIT